VFEFIFGNDIMILKEVKESKGVHGWVRINAPFVTL
jgi:hypothetical protein